MIGKIKRLFSLERALQNSLNQASSNMSAELDRIEKKIDSHHEYVSRIRASFGERLSRIEVLLEEELKEKERKRDILVKEHAEKALNG